MNNNLVPEIFLVDSEEETLVIFDTYFVVYQNNKPLFFKKIEGNLKLDDLKIFIRNHLGIENIKVLPLKDVRLREQSKKIDYRFIKAVRDYQFVYYLLYLCVLVFVTIYFFIGIEDKYEKDNFNNLKKNIEKVKKDKKFTYISKEVLVIYENAKENKVLIKSILFENSKFQLVLESKKKEGIYKLLTSIKESSINDIQYNKKEKKYKSHVSFKISRN